MTPTDPTPPKASPGQGPNLPRASARHAPRHDPYDAHRLDAYHEQHGHKDHDGLYNEDVAHEYSDVNVRAVLMFCAGLVGITVVVMVAMGYLFNLFVHRAAENDPIVSPLAVPAGLRPPAPRLEENEPRVLENVRSAETQQLQQYGWIDEKSGSVRIPIDEAKKQILQTGLPVRGVPVQPWMGTYAPARGESSSGRLIPLKPEGVGPARPAQPGASQPPTKPEPPHKGGH